MSRHGSLLALAAADERLAALRQEVTALEATLEGDSELDRRHRVAAEARADHERAEQEARRIEAEVAETRHRATLLERRLYDGSVRNPAELLGMQRELEPLQARLTSLEERLLGAMEGSEVAEDARDSADAAVAERESDRASQAGPLAQRLSTARVRLNEAAAERRQIAGELDPADLATYDRVKSRRTPAVVRLQGDTCSGCRLPLAPHEVHEIRAGAVVVQCSNCDRILVP